MIRFSSTFSFLVQTPVQPTDAEPANVDYLSPVCHCLDSETGVQHTAKCHVVISWFVFYIHNVDISMRCRKITINR